MAVVAAKRLRDLNINGNFAIALIGLQIVLWVIDADYIFGHVFVASFLLLAFLPPQRKDNKYGPYTPHGLFKSHKDRTYTKDEGFSCYLYSKQFLCIGTFYATICYLFFAIISTPNAIASEEPLTYTEIITGVLMLWVSFGIIMLLITKEALTVRVTSKGIRATNHFITDCLWEEIETVKVRRTLLYLAGKVIYIKNKKGRTLLKIPYKGLTDYDDFVKKCIEKAPADNPLPIFLKSHQ